MPAPSEAVRLKSRIGGIRRHDPDADVTDLQAELLAAKIEAWIDRAVGEPRPFTPETKAIVRALFRPYLTAEWERSA